MAAFARWPQLFGCSSWCFCFEGFYLYQLAKRARERESPPPCWTFFCGTYYVSCHNCAFTAKKQGPKREKRDKSTRRFFFSCLSCRGVVDGMRWDETKDPLGQWAMRNSLVAFVRWTATLITVRSSGLRGKLIGYCLFRVYR